MGKKRQADVVCCCRYKGDNAEQCEATMTSGMEGLALHNERLLFSFFTTLISAFMESEEVSKFRAQCRGTRNKRLQRVQRSRGVTLPGVENMIPCLARAHTHDSFSPPFKAICIPAPPPPPPCAPLLLSAPPNSRQRFFLRSRRRFLILTSISQEIIDHPK